MKLYYAQGTCSHAPHIALREAGLPFTLVRYDMKAHVLEDGSSLEAVNDKGYVPVLELDDGRRLTEVAVVLQYIADLKPEANLAPPNGTFERYRLQEWLNFLGTEVHKAFWPFFHDGSADERAAHAERLGRRLAWVEGKLGDRPFLMDQGFTVADAYLVTMLNWLRAAGFDPERWQGLKAYRARLRERPAVKAALEAEGLLRTRK